MCQSYKPSSSNNPNTSEICFICKVNNHFELRQILLIFQLLVWLNHAYQNCMSRNLHFMFCSVLLIVKCDDFTKKMFNHMPNSCFHTNCLRRILRIDYFRSIFKIVTFICGSFNVFNSDILTSSSISFSQQSVCILKNLLVVCHWSFRQQQHATLQDACE